MASYYRVRAFPGFAYTILTLVLLAGCAGSPRRFDPIPAGDPTVVLDRLAERAVDGVGAKAFASLKMNAAGRRDSFSARFLLDTHGRIRIDVLSPFGTAAYSIFADGREATVIDRVRSTYWKGQSSSLGALVPLFATGLTSSDIGRLLLGFLPSGVTEGADPNEILTSGGARARYEMASQGLASVSLASVGSMSLLFRYLPAVFPPSRILVMGGVGPSSFELEIRYLELEPWNGQLTAPELRGLTCCHLPGG
ncbi:MAG TPA: hypothetical protein VNM92_08480 [Thermoanaerobaculia bacterium]|nr:hypothetical protein [Thermoanaerobaculia bacterium]